MKRLGVQTSKASENQKAKRESIDDEELKSNKIPRVTPDPPKPFKAAVEVNQVEVGFSSEFDFAFDEDIEEIHRLHLDNSPKPTKSHLRVIPGVLSSLERVSPAECHIQFTYEKKTVGATLKDEWASLFPLLSPGMRVQVVLENGFGEEDSFEINRERNYFIVEPDVLIPSTLLSDSFSCLRRCILSLRTQASIEDKRPTSSLLVGSIAHELVGHVLETGKCDSQVLEEKTQELIKENMVNLHACRTELSEVQENLSAIRESLPAWTKRVFQTGAAVVEPSNKPQSSIFADPMITLTPALDIEESVWSRTFGIKGKMDATVVVQGKGKDRPYKVIAPFELKTGKSTTSVSHRAQTIAYTLALSDKYSTSITLLILETPINSALLFYVSVGDIYRIEATRRELLGIVLQRNRAIIALKSTFSLPPTISNGHICSTCFHKEYCLLYSEVFLVFLS